MSTAPVRTAEPDDRASAIHVLTLAFASDPAVRWMYPEAQAYLTHFPRFAEAFGGKALEEKTACLAHDLGGAALWLPPGVHADGDAIGAIVGESADRASLDEIASVFGEMDRYHPKEPHWYLAMIGVDPSRQGRGIGSSLLASTLSRVDSEGMPAYLESSNPANVPLYERHGFEVQGEIRGAEGPPVFPMFRPVR
jgi:ribosomal protein S18 acetylase RimI-like enzyme